MKALYERGFPVPKPVDFNRHCVIMELVNGYPLHQINEIGDAEQLYDDLMNLIVKLGNHGVIHGDFNEFNIMVTDDAKPILIDFPQMVSTSHPLAKMFFDRDVTGVREWFKKKYGFDSSDYPKFEDLEREDNLDIEVSCSGFTKEMEMDLLNEYHPEGSEDEGEENSESDSGEINDTEAVIDEYKKGVEVEVKFSEEKKDKTSSIMKYMQSMSKFKEFDKAFTEEDELQFQDAVSDLKITESKPEVPETSNTESSNKVTEEIDDGASMSSNDLEIPEMDDELKELDPNSREYRMKMVRKLLSDVRSQRTTSTAASTIAPSVVTDRVKKNIDEKNKRDMRRRIVPKGEASAVRRMRIENKDVVKDYAGWV